MILLENDSLKLTVDPENGAAIWDVCAKIAGLWQPICANCKEAFENKDSKSSAIFVMVPFANRVRKNTIIDGDRKWHISANTDEPLALHGTGWERPWEIVSTNSHMCTLRLSVSDSFPIHFAADYSITLEGNSICLQLTLYNALSQSIPVGMGFHPYFPRYHDTQLQFEAVGYWEEGSDYLPTVFNRMSESQSYSGSKPLPSIWQNICYSDWERSARIKQPTLGYFLDVSASKDLDFLMVFTSPSSDRFAIEPQSHLSGQTQVTRGGLRSLMPNHSWKQEMKLTVNEI